MTKTQFKPFYIAAHELGSTNTHLPLWASYVQNPLELKASATQLIFRTEVEGVPGAFQLHNVLSKDECQSFIKAAEQMGYTEDAAVSLSRNIRHNMNINWITDHLTEQIIWSRIADLINQNNTHFLNKNALGLNQRFRFYRYEKGDYFAIHTDGAWPGSRIINEKPVTDAFGDRYSLYTCLIFLSENFTGGATEFLIDRLDPNKPAHNPHGAEKKGIRTPAGSMLCFPHGSHPLHCLHGSAMITSGVKYIIRTDILFSL